MYNLNYLQDKNFLQKLDNYPSREIHARVTALTWDELPVELIEGKVTGGSIAIDGTSALRRTCSVTLSAQDVVLNEFYWGLNTKIKLDIGITNPQIDNRYTDDILWFPQGIYILTSFNTSKNVSSYSINISGKDKMCMLNGDLGGNIDTSITFDSEEDEHENIIKIPIATIIKNLLCVFGHEDIRNVLIADVDNYGYELLDYYGDKPLYLLKKYNEEIYYNMTFNGDIDTIICSWDKSENKPTLTSKTCKLKDFEENGYEYDPGMNAYVKNDGTVVALSRAANADNQYCYTVRRLRAGDVVGYRLSELIYPSDLTAKAGDTITSVLDKIVSMLGNYEYFYDINGQFVFQEKKNNIHSDWSSVKEGESGLYIDPLTSPIVYTFFDSPLFTAITHNPQLNKIKNDYSIWGSRKLPSGVEDLIHLRCALERKPEEYISIAYTELEAIEFSRNYYLSKGYSEEEISEMLNNKQYAIRVQESKKYSDCEWREIIYQMASDFFAYSQLEDFKLRVAKYNSEKYPHGITGYEDFYTDFIKDWRRLYNPDFKRVTTNTPDWNQAYYEKVKTSYSPVTVDDVFRPKLGREISVQLYNSLGNLVSVNASASIDTEGKYYTKNDDGSLKDYTDIYVLKTDKIYYYREGDSGEFLYNQKERGYWNKNVFENPSILPFWFELYGENTPLEKYMISSIGDRSKVINDKDITSIYYAETPDILFITDEEYIEQAGKELPPQYTQIRMAPGMEKMFTISTQGKTAQMVFESALYDNTYLNDTVNITAIPIYYLEPNTRIEIYDQESSINGEYIITRITLPLTYNGTMQITAAKAETIIY